MLVKMLMTDQADAAVFDMHLGSGAALGRLVVCVEWFALPMYGALCVTLLLLKFLLDFI
jgi:hypothetical protein